MTEAGKRVYRYSVAEDGKSIEVEHAGIAELHEGDKSPEQKAKDLIVSTQQIPEGSFEIKKVDDINDGVITTDDTYNK